ncbi:MAG: hypothetical protein ACI870_000470 [Crocinitomicaceae bacterium]|jgi:hypothetical protein
MELSNRTIIIRSIGLIFFIFVIIFGYNRFERYINGPEIIEISLKEFQQIDTLSLNITGKIRNVESISIEGRVITFNKENMFEEIVVLSPGYTIIDIDLIDPFGKEKKYSYAIESTATNEEYMVTLNEARTPILEEPTEESEIN